MKLVIRLLDGDGQLLGWTEHDAAVPGDGSLRASSAVAIPIDVAGTTAFCSTHWADINVETRVPCPVMDVKPGDTFGVFNYRDEIVRVGPAAGGLPPVTVKNHAVVAVPAGALGARG